MPESSIVVRPEAPGSPTYTSSSRLQAAGLRSAIDLFVERARVVPLPQPPHPVVIADYGASTGYNSLLPIGAAIAVLRERIRGDQAVIVTHTDVADNDFGQLFTTLASDPDSYLTCHSAAFATAIGRSFYTQILPSDSVTLGWSSWAIHWLSKLPAPVHDHVLPQFSDDTEVRDAAERQAAGDWHEFVAFRGRELVPQGRLVVLTVGIGESGELGMRPLIEAVHHVLGELVAAGLVTTEERAAMTVPIVGRIAKDLLAPFMPKGRFEGLSVEHLDISDAEDRFWHQFQTDQDAAGFGARWAAFLRAAVFGVLVTGLAGGAHDPRAGEFCDQLETGVARRLAAKPEPIKITLAWVVLAKAAPAP